MKTKLIFGFVTILTLFISCNNHSEQKKEKPIVSDEVLLRNQIKIFINQQNIIKDFGELGENVSTIYENKIVNNYCLSSYKSINKKTKDSILYKSIQESSIGWTKDNENQFVVNLIKGFNKSRLRSDQTGVLAVNVKDKLKTIYKNPMDAIYSFQIKKDSTIVYLTRECMKTLTMDMYKSLKSQTHKR